MVLRSAIVESGPLLQLILCNFPDSSTPAAFPQGQERYYAAEVVLCLTTGLSVWWDKLEMRCFMSVPVLWKFEVFTTRSKVVLLDCFAFQGPN